MTKKMIIKFLENDVKSSIVNDVKEVALWHAQHQKGKEAGFLGIPRQVFCYVDYLGSVASDNTSTTQNAEDFIKKYFPSNYQNYAELVYSMWRHGTVHEYKPKTYFAQYSGRTPKIIIAWLSNNDSKQANRNQHLKFFPMEGKRNSLYLCINTCQLVDDLLYALDKFICNLKTDKTLEQACQKRLQIVNSPQDYTTIKRQKSKVAVFNQILSAWKNRAKEKIDKRGTVIKKNT